MIGEWAWRGGTGSVNSCTYSSDSSQTLQQLVLPSNSSSSSHEDLHLHEPGVGVPRHVVGQHASKGQQHARQRPQLGPPLVRGEEIRVHPLEHSAMTTYLLPPPILRSSSSRAGDTTVRGRELTSGRGSGCGLPQLLVLCVEDAHGGQQNVRQAVVDLEGGRGAPFRTELKIVAGVRFGSIHHYLYTTSYNTGVIVLCIAAISANFNCSHF